MKDVFENGNKLCVRIEMHGETVERVFLDAHTHEINEVSIRFEATKRFSLLLDLTHLLQLDPVS